jgi:hypothetical protein
MALPSLPMADNAQHAQTAYSLVPAQQPSAKRSRGFLRRFPKGSRPTDRDGNLIAKRCRLKGVELAISQQCATLANFKLPYEKRLAALRVLLKLARQIPGYSPPTPPQTKPSIPAKDGEAW